MSVLPLHKPQDTEAAQFATDQIVLGEQNL